MKKIRLYFIIPIILGCTLSIKAQITGRIINEKLAPLPYATIALYSNDSTFVEGTVADSEGYFTFNYNKLPYLLEIQHISYVKRKNTYNTLICGDIEMKENSEFLQGVTITTNHPIVTVDKSGGLIYSANAIRERYIADTIYELIKKLPGVIEQNNHLSLIGSNGLKIIINGRLSSMTFDQLTSFLQSLPADRVTHLKVMYNPPPKYQTRGAVINVELSRAIEFQGEVHSEYTNKHTNTFKSGTNILLPLEKIGIDFSYEYASLAKLTEVDFTGKHNLHGIYYSIIQQQAIRGRENNNQIRIGFDASLSEKSSLNTTYNASLSPKNSTRTNSHGNFILAENRKN